MISHRRAVACVLVVSVLSSCTGCHSMRRVQPATTPGAPAFERIQHGDTVSLVMNDGRRARFVVASIEPDTLVSKNGERYARADMRELKQRHMSGVKTGLLIGGIVAGVVLVALGAAYASLVSAL